MYCACAGGADRKSSGSANARVRNSLVAPTGNGIILMLLSFEKGPCPCLGQNQNQARFTPPVLSPARAVDLPLQRRRHVGDVEPIRGDHPAVRAGRCTASKSRNPARCNNPRRDAAVPGSARSSRSAARFGMLLEVLHDAPIVVGQVGVVRQPGPDRRFRGGGGHGIGPQTAWSSLRRYHKPRPGRYSPPRNQGRRPSGVTTPSSETPGCRSGTGRSCR